MTGTAKGGRSGKPSDGPPPPPPPPPAAPPYCDLVCQCQGCNQQPAAPTPNWVSWDPNANQGAVLGGQERGGTPLHVCRAKYNDGIHPGKLIDGGCKIGWGDREVRINTPFEILVRAGAWQAPQGNYWQRGWSGNGAFLGGAEPANRSGPARDLFICRASYNGGLHPGKVVDGNCNIAADGGERRIPQYEVFYAR